MTNETDQTLRPEDKELLLQHTDRSWEELIALLASLSEEQMTASGADGWSVKDHLAHLTAWERSMLFLLRRRPRYEGLGVDEATYLAGGTEGVNDEVYRRSKERPLAKVITEFKQVHDEFRALVASLSVEDLARPYAYYLPDEPDDNRVSPPPPILNWIVGNGYDHIDEHRSWMQALSASGNRH